MKACQKKKKKKTHKGKANQKEIFTSIDFLTKKIIAGNFLKIHCKLLKDPDFQEYVTTIKLYALTNID